jgi:hypothetical protein
MVICIASSDIFPIYSFQSLFLEYIAIASSDNANAIALLVNATHNNQIAMPALSICIDNIQVVSSCITNVFYDRLNV